MLKKVQQAVIQLSVHAERTGRIRDLKRFVVSTAAMFRSPAQAISDVQGFLETAAKHEVETRSWVGPEALRNGNGGAFDACDLRHWLVLAERAGVPFVPAREILHLTEEEMSLLSGEINLPDTPAVRRLRKGAESVVAELGIDPQSNPEPAPIDREALVDSLFDSMDDIPEGWMVRSNRCGGSELKSLAGFGVIGREVPEVRFGPNLEVGPGWVRLGNRRRVNVSDARTVKAAAEGPGFMVFLARPWQECSRYIAGDDPHRHGTPYAGKGVWPAEWRAIVQGGQVVGVASYYGWCDEATPETAATALEVRKRAQAIVDEALRLKAFPRYMDIEFARDANWLDQKPGLAKALATDWSRETVSCTLDFIETSEGPKFLEGGPSVSPFGGGHPCAFAGVLSARLGEVPQISGVAFRVMDHVTLADPSTWSDGERQGRILSWNEVEKLASPPEDNPFSQEP